MRPIRPGKPSRCATQSSRFMIMAVNEPQTATITSPAADANFSAPANIAITATAADDDGTVTNVQFFANDELIGQTASMPYNMTWMGVTPGNYDLTVQATDNN